MNKVYKALNVFLIAYNFVMLFEILAAVIASRPDFIMRFRLGLNGDRVFIQWMILFLLFLFEYLFFLRKNVSRKTLVLSAIMTVLNFYLSYLFLFIHTPDIFTARDLAFATKRFFTHLPLLYFGEILLGLSFLVIVKLKSKKGFHGAKVNAFISAGRVVFLWLSSMPLLIMEGSGASVDDVNKAAFAIILISAVCFLVSFVLELATDFILCSYHLT